MHNLVCKVGLRQWRGREAQEPWTVIEDYACPVAVPKLIPSQELQLLLDFLT